jgi:hypothetical protein
MSKPNLLGFRTSVGFYRNRRVRDCRESLGRLIRRKVPFCDLAPMLFQATMAYAAENQIDGNFEGYSVERWTEIFCSANIPVSPAEAASIKKEFQRVGLFDGDKIRSWSMFNREFAQYAVLTKYRQRAGKLSAKKRELEAKAALKNGNGEHTETTPKPEKIPSKTASKADSPSKQIWLLNQQLEATADPAERKQLERRKRELLRESSGVKPAPSPAPSAKNLPPRKTTAAEQERTDLTIAQSMLNDYPDGLTTEHVRRLVKAGVKLPDQVAERFRRLFSQLNPVPE